MDRKQLAIDFAESLKYHPERNNSFYSNVDTEGVVIV
jgi:hypothetical protein